MVAVAQLVRVPGCGPGGRGFESHQPPHLTILRKACGFAYFNITNNYNGHRRSLSLIFRRNISLLPQAKISHRKAIYHTPQGVYHLYIGASSSGKTTDFDSVIRWFESSRPSQKKQPVRNHRTGCFHFNRTPKLSFRLCTQRMHLFFQRGYLQGLYRSQNAHPFFRLKEQNGYYQG